MEFFSFNRRREPDFELTSVVTGFREWQQQKGFDLARPEDAGEQFFGHERGEGARGYDPGGVHAGTGGACSASRRLIQASHSDRNSLAAASEAPHPVVDRIWLSQ